MGFGQAGTRPRLGLRPTSPHMAEGIRIDPPPSVPCATGTIPEATDAAEPPLEPPVEYSVFQGLWHGPYRSGSVAVVLPNSGALVIPTTTIPAAL